MTTKNTFFFLAAFLSAVPALAQNTPDGSDISKAIPIYFGQTIADIGDSSLKPFQVYKISLARGQQFNVVADAVTGRPTWYMAILSPTALSVGSLTNAQRLVQTGGGSFGTGTSWALSYEVPAAGNYFVVLEFNSTGVNYTLKVNAQGTPLGVPNPPQAGCLSGQVDYLTYSLQLLAVNLPDTVSIGGVQLCATCTVKPPLYAQIVKKLEKALSRNLPVQACYDADGNIVQISLQHQ
jgi:hypothetical protein